MFVAIWSLVNAVVVLTIEGCFLSFHKEVAAFMLSLITGLIKMLATVSSGTLLSHSASNTFEHIPPASGNFTIVVTVLQGVDDVIPVSLRASWHELLLFHEGNQLIVLPFGHAPIILLDNT